MMTMKRWLRSLPCLFTMSALGGAAPAQADFRLTKPTAWIVEDAQGSPQKAGPCGPESEGDAMLTHALTEVKAGATIEVELDETTPHAGWFRIALAENRSELEEVSFSDSSCASTMPAVPHGNVLADGLGKTDAAGSKRSLKEKITLPHEPCDKCTLQVIQVMTDASSECVHYHCADIKIVAADSGSGGTSGGAGMAGAPHATGGSSSAPVSMRTTGGMGADAAKAGSAGAPSTGPLVAAATTQTGSAGTASKTNNATIKHAAVGGAGGKPAANSGKSAKQSESKSKSENDGKSSDAGADSGAEQAEEDSSESEEAESMHEAKAEDGGCVVSQPGAHKSLVSAALFALASVLLGVRRRRPM